MHAHVCVCLSFQIMANFTYLVGYNLAGGTTVNKLITVSRKCALLARAEAIFGVAGDSCAIEYYDKQYDEYIRPDAPEEIPDGGKVRLIQSPAAVLDESTLSTTSTVPILRIQPTGVDLQPDKPPMLLAPVGRSPTLVSLSLGRSVLVALL